MLHERQRKKLNRQKPSKWAVTLPHDYAWKVLSATLADVRHITSKEHFPELDQIIRSRDFNAYLEWGRNWTLQCMSSAAAVDISEWRLGYGMASLVRKFQFPGDNIARKELALTKFKIAERDCSRYNTRGHREQSQSEQFHKMESAVRNQISRIIGDLLPDFELLTNRARHGPGSDSGTSKGRISQYFKYSEWPYDVTLQALPYARDMIAQDARWLGALEQDYRRQKDIKEWEILNQDLFWKEVFHVIDGNRITTVAKDALTERPIAIEPTLNLMLQLGVDGFIRKRLKRWNIDLDTQEINQGLAYEGSIRKDVRAPVTIDMRSASDMISLRTCKSLLPTGWYEYLTAIRSPKGTLPDGSTLRFSKMSSMGNGYTFALESLIFVAIGMVATRRTLARTVERPYAEVHIHGDDLIVPECAGGLTIALLESFGFQINTEKSFLSGEVKESCGTDWYRGHNMRPVFLKEKPHNPMGLLSDRNRIVRWLSLALNGGYPIKLQRLDGLIIERWLPDYICDIVGPISDNEFDTYVHTAVEPTFRCTDGRFYFSGYTCNLVTEKACDDLFFRKLMHSLTPARPNIVYDEGPTTTKAGSRFDVIRRQNRPRLSVVNRISWEWNVAYGDKLPALPACKGGGAR